MSLLSFIPGRWSSIPPTSDGVYFMRSATDRTEQVRYWQTAPWSANRANGTSQAAWEFFYLIEDTDGAPTRADDARPWDIARRNGWTPPRRCSSR